MSKRQITRTTTIYLPTVIEVTVEVDLGDEDADAEIVRVSRAMWQPDFDFDQVKPDEQCELDDIMEEAYEEAHKGDGE